MALESLDHCAIRTTRLEETRRFYVEALAESAPERWSTTCCWIGRAFTPKGSAAFTS